MAVGRPPKYKPEYCDQVVEFMGKQGKSVTQFAAHIGVVRETIWDWRKKHEEFSNAFMHAEQMSQSFWEEELIGMMRDPKVNAPLVKLYFANRFKWHDRPVEQEQKDLPPINITLSKD